MIPDDPQPQKGRSKSRCKCELPCFYCGRSLVGERHEHDHIPIPWRHGGRETAPACVRCHRRKEAPYGILKGSERDLEAVDRGSNDRALFGYALKITRVVHGVDGAEVLGRDEAVQMLALCTTPEARIALAHGIAHALDAAQILAEDVAA